jgi:hypothetical protein
MKTLNAILTFKIKKAIIRVDFNVPLDENFNVTDATVLKRQKLTIDAILALKEEAQFQCTKKYYKTLHVLCHLQRTSTLPKVLLLSCYEATAL